MSRKLKKRIGRVLLYLMVILIVIVVVAPFAWMAYAVVPGESYL